MNSFYANILAHLILTTLLQFYTNPTRGNLKKLNAIEDTLTHVTPIKDQNTPQITQYQSQMDLLRESMGQQLLLMQDSLLQDSAIIQYQLLKQDYMLLSNQKQDLVGEIMQKRNELANDGLMANNNFEPENYNEYLSKTVNDIYYRTYGRGVDTLTAQDITLLQGIIHICPQAGGPAVYRARALYITVNDTIVYNDSLVCREANFFRESQEEWEQKAAIKVKKDDLSVYLYPNPAKDKLMVLFNGDIDAGKIEIYNLTGAIVATFNINKSSKNQELDISPMAEGYYLIHFTLGNYYTVKPFIKIK